MEISKITIATIASILVLTIAAFVVIVPAVNPAETDDYGDLLQYEWPSVDYDPERTRFSAGPAPNAPDVLWKSNPSEIGYLRGAFMGAYVVAFNDKIIVLTQQTGAYYLNALDPFTGEIIWRSVVPIPDGFTVPPPSQATTSPVAYRIDDTHFILPLSSLDFFTRRLPGAIACFETKTGEYLWTQFDMWSWNPGGANYFPYLVVPEEKMLYTSVNTINRTEPATAAFDISDPSKPFPEAWRRPMTEASEILCYGDGKIFMGSMQWDVYALNAKTGKLLWETPRKGRAVYSGTYYNGKVYVSCGSTRLTTYDGSTGNIVWEYEAGDIAFFAWGGAAAYGMYYQHTLGVPNGHVTAWDAETGDVIWRHEVFYFFGYFRPVVADGKVFINTGDFVDPLSAWGREVQPSFTCFDAYTGETLWQLPFGIQNPSIAYGNLYTDLGGILYAFGSPKSWSMWRGTPDIPGVAEGQTGPTDLTVEWMYETGGAVTSSPAVVDGKVYIGSHDKNLYCLDARDGGFIWKFNLGVKYRSSPAAINGRVYTGADDGYIHCLDAETGTQIWQTFAGGVTDYLFHSSWQPRSSPVIADGKLFVGALDGKVYCLNTANGDILWTYQTELPIGGSPAVADNIVYIASTDGYLYALNTAEGTFIWRTFIPNSTLRGPVCLVSSPVVGGGKVFITDATEEPPDVLAFDAKNGTILYSVSSFLGFYGSPPLSAPAYYDETVYVSANSNVTAFNAANGTKIWTQFVSFMTYSSPVYANDLRGGKVYVGSDSYGVTCLNAATGEPLSVYMTSGEVDSSPAVWEGKLYIGSADWNIYCFEEARLTDSVVPEASVSPSMLMNPEPTEPEATEPEPTEPTTASVITTEQTILAAVAISFVIGAVSFWGLRKQRK